MDLKFTFGGASSDDHRDDAPSGVPLSFTLPPSAASSILEVRVERTGPELGAEAVSGDGVVYASARVPIDGADGAALARALRSAVSRTVAGLEGPLADAVSAVVLGLGGDEAETLGEFGIPTVSFDEPDAAIAIVSEDFQRRTGVASGTPIRIARAG